MNTARMGWPWRPRLHVLRIVVLMFCTWEFSRPGCRSDLGIATSVSGMGWDDASNRRTGTLCLGRWCLRDRQVERASQQLCFATRAFCSGPKKAGSRQSRFSGVYWHRRHQKFEVRLWFQGRSHFVGGYFSNDTEAACAFDAKLRGNVHRSCAIEEILELSDEGGGIL